MNILVETYRVSLGSMSLENHVSIGTMLVEHILSPLGAFQHLNLGEISENA